MATGQATLPGSDDPLSRPDRNSPFELNSSPLKTGRSDATSSSAMGGGPTPKQDLFWNQDLVTLKQALVATKEEWKGKLQEMESRFISQEARWTAELERNRERIESQVATSRLEFYFGPTIFIICGHSFLGWESAECVGICGVVF